MLLLGRIDGACIVGGDQVVHNVLVRDATFQCECVSYSLPELGLVGRSAGGAGGAVVDIREWNGSNLLLAVVETCETQCWDGDLGSVARGLLKDQCPARELCFHGESGVLSVENVGCCGIDVASMLKERMKEEE